MMQFAAIGNITLHYRLDGQSDGPALVFIHSLGTDLRIWDEVVGCFERDYRIVRYDLRGHGLSDCPPGPYSMKDHMNDLVGLLDFLDSETTIVVGISVGGMIAMAFAAAKPERVRALVLADTSVAIGSPALWSERIENLQRDGMELMADTLVARWFAATFAAQHPFEYHGYRNMLIRTPLEGYIATCGTLRDTDLRHAVRTIKAKTLVLCGEEDVSTPPDTGRALTEMLPDARFSLIENAGHLPCVEQSEKMATLIKEFIQENSYDKV